MAQKRRAPANAGAKRAAKAPPKAKRAKGAKSVGLGREEGYTTTSTFSPRMAQVYGDLEREVERRFPGAEKMFEYGMRGWRVPRRKRIDTWKGTIDPNFLYIGIAERKQGITLHYWNPLSPGGFDRHAPALAAAGFKVMVGCLQYNRKGDYPIGALLPMLDDTARRLKAEG
jgi:hypothetical protein